MNDSTGSSVNPFDSGELPGRNTAPRRSKKRFRGGNNLSSGLDSATEREAPDCATHKTTLEHTADYRASDGHAPKSEQKQQGTRGTPVCCVGPRSRRRERPSKRRTDPQNSGERARTHTRHQVGRHTDGGLSTLVYIGRQYSCSDKLAQKPQKQPGCHTRGWRRQRRFKFCAPSSKHLFRKAFNRARHNGNDVRQVGCVRGELCDTGRRANNDIQFQPTHTSG
jgi:hypothetical protein